MTFIQQIKVLSKRILFLFFLLLSNLGWSNHFDSQIPKAIEIANQESSNLFFTSQRQFSPQPFWGNDVLIDNQYPPHSASSLASNCWYYSDIYCAMKSKYNDYWAVLTFKSTNGGLNWTFFGGAYIDDPSLELSSPAIALSCNYVTIAFILCPTGTTTDTGLVYTYRQPLSGGSGDFFTFPHPLGSDPDLFYSGYGDSLFVTFLYWYGGNDRLVEFYYSTNGGYSWTQASPVTYGDHCNSPKIACNKYSTHLEEFIAYSSESGIIFSKSTNFGSSWTEQIISSSTEFHLDIASEIWYGSYNYLVIITTNKCYWSSNGGSSWNNYNLGTVGTQMSCEYNSYSSEFVAANILYPRIHFQSSSGYPNPPTGFADPWTAIDDASSVPPIYQPGLCEIESDNLVSWVDSRTKIMQVYCDNSDWGSGIKDDYRLSTFNNYYVLYQNSPNPVRNRTFIKYSIPEKSKVELKVFDVGGKEVATLLDKEQSGGFYTVNWDIRDISKNKLANGVYFYHLKAGNYEETKKMVIVR
ncbi:MAG: T9SS type A sorting domain-containing protein [Candidatus Marinimicrobia bacterium]|nr:T9SS type A sorting domain-containing protein [Candidatus Neomarinimicrobiota bacterium]